MAISAAIPIATTTGPPINEIAEIPAAVPPTLIPIAANRLTPFATRMYAPRLPKPAAHIAKAPYAATPAKPPAKVPFTSKPLSTLRSFIGPSEILFSKLSRREFTQSENSSEYPFMEFKYSSLSRLDILEQIAFLSSDLFSNHFA